MKDGILGCNSIVHLYWQVDDRRVYQIIEREVGDLDRFRQQILAWPDVS